MKIVSPCHENYSTMEKKDGGRHCLVCEKTVIDFTGMSNPEIVSYLEKHNSESVCGRLKNYQLERPYLPVRLLLQLKEFISYKTSITPLRVALLSMISGLLALTTSCMGKMMPKTPVENNHPQQDTVKTKKKN